MKLLLNLKLLTMKQILNLKEITTNWFKNEITKWEILWLFNNHMFIILLFALLYIQYLILMWTSEISSQFNEYSILHSFSWGLFLTKIKHIFHFPWRNKNSIDIYPLEDDTFYCRGLQSAKSRAKKEVDQIIQESLEEAGFNRNLFDNFRHSSFFDDLKEFRRTITASLLEYTKDIRGLNTASSIFDNGDVIDPYMNVGRYVKNTVKKETQKLVQSWKNKYCSLPPIPNELEDQTFEESHPLIFTPGFLNDDYKDPNNWVSEWFDSTESLLSSSILLFLISEKYRTLFKRLFRVYSIIIFLSITLSYIIGFNPLNYLLSSVYADTFTILHMNMDIIDMNIEEYEEWIRCSELATNSFVNTMSKVKDWLYKSNPGRFINHNIYDYYCDTLKLKSFLNFSDSEDSELSNGSEELIGW